MANKSDTLKDSSCRMHGGALFQMVNKSSTPKRLSSCTHEKAFFLMVNESIARDG
jgi:hypothetical protein